jgi:hypothetical protein
MRIHKDGVAPAAYVAKGTEAGSSMRTSIIGLACALSLVTGVALGQRPAATQSQPGLSSTPARTFDVRRMSFELWCQETQQYAIARCDARQPADVKAFEDYRAAVERYEIQYQRQREQQRVMQDRLNRDRTTTTNTLQDAPVR